MPDPVDPSLIETVAAGVAHEVRNPLNSVQINLRILEQELRRALPDEGAHAFELLARIGAEIRRLDGFVAEFLRFARPPRLALEGQPLGPLLTDLATFLRPECARRGVELRLAVEDGRRDVLADAFQLKQALLNLVLNALQASHEGGTITVRAGARGERATVEVDDDGEGIPDELREKVFTLFFTTREGGTGLGLPIARRIVEEHGGTLSLDARPGGGTRATVTLPAAPPSGR